MGGFESRRDIRAIGTGGRLGVAPVMTDSSGSGIAANGRLNQTGAVTFPAACKRNTPGWHGSGPAGLQAGGPDFSLHVPSDRLRTRSRSSACHTRNSYQLSVSMMSTRSMISTIAASTGAHLFARALARSPAFPAINTFPECPHRTPSTASSARPTRCVVRGQWLHEQQLGAFELAVLLSGDHGADYSGNLPTSILNSHFSLSLSTSQ